MRGGTFSPLRLHTEKGTWVSSRSPWSGLRAKPHHLPKPEPPNTFSLGLRALTCESGELALSGVRVREVLGKRPCRVGAGLPPARCNRVPSSVQCPLRP